MADIFVSYASEDRALVDALVAEGWSVWWDRDLVPGHAFDERIERALAAAYCVIVVWSEHSVASRWCRVEAGEGLERDILVPLRIDDVRPPLAFRGEQTASLVAWPRQPGELEAVFRGVRERISAFRQTSDAQLTEPAPAPDEQSAAPSLVVLPFRNLSRNPDDAFLADGVARDLSQLLAMIPAYRVTPDSTADTFAGSDQSPAEIARAIGVRYVVSGSLERRGPRFRLRVGVTDCVAERRIWSKHYDAPIEEFFDVQDDLILRISSAITSEVDGDVARARADARSFEIDVYSRIQEAEEARRIYRPESSAFIIRTLEEVLAEHPGDAVAHAFLAMQHAQNLVNGWSQDLARSAEAARDHLDRARAIAPSDPRVLMAAAASAMMNQDFHEAAHLAQLSLQGNPSEAHARALLGWATGMLGEHDAGLALIASAQHMAPHHPRAPIWISYRATILMVAVRFEEALAAFEELLRVNPVYGMACLNLALVRRSLDPHAMIDETLRKAFELIPGMTFERFRDLTVNFARAAGVEPSEIERLGLPSLEQDWDRLGGPRAGSA